MRQGCYKIGDFNVSGKKNAFENTKRTTKRTETLIDHILTNSLEKVIQTGITEIR